MSEQSPGKGHETPPTSVGFGTRPVSPSQLRHDLLTPLNQILGYSQLLQDKMEDQGQKELLPDLVKIESAGRRLVTLIDELMNPARMPSPERAAAPAAPAEKPAAPAAAPVVSAVSTKKAHLLVVDDNELNRDMLARRLIQKGYTATVADGGEAALRMVREKRPDLILLDVMMPGISGLDVLKTLRTTLTMAELPIIMATARDTSEDIVEALNLGANDYVTKPLDFAVVLARIETQIGLKRARDQVQKLAEQLREAQARITRLVESSSQAMQDIPAWAQQISVDLAQTVGGPEIGVYVQDGDQISPLFPTATEPPTPESLLMAGKTREFVSRKKDTIVPVFGMTGQLYGALVLPGRVGIFDDDEHRLVASFAHQLGGALELQKTRKELSDANERKRVTRQGMLDKGIDVLQICPRCGLCYDQKVKACKADGRKLESPRTFPYRILDRYRLVQLLGEGGMGTVFHAYDLKLDRDVAVKVIKSEHFNDASLRMRFEYEARAVARIDHEGVVGIYDSGELEDGSLFLVMEKLQGKDLNDVLRTFGRGTPRQVAELIRQGSAALMAAHNAGLVHRDIKPDNVFLVDQPDGGFKVKILDFGVAKQVNADTHLTRTGLIVGTPAYMSPEQVTSKDVDTRSDLYSFAAVAYEALTGRRVTVEEDLARIFVEVLQAVPPAPSTIVPGLPPEIDQAFARALAKKPQDRPPDLDTWASSFVRTLERLPSDVPGWMPSRDRGSPKMDFSTRAL